MEKGVFLQHTFLPTDWAHTGHVSGTGGKEVIACVGCHPGVESQCHFPFALQAMRSPLEAAILWVGPAAISLFSLRAAGSQSCQLGRDSAPTIWVTLFSGIS